MNTGNDLEVLIPVFEGDAASGPDLEYDPDFLALEAAATPKAERAMGSSVIAAEPADWPRVETLARGLCARAHDLRVAVHLCAARVSGAGLPGWAEGLALVHGLLDRHWDSVHPQLDAEDDNDPTARVNAVLALADPGTVLGLLRAAPFVQSPRLGRFSLRDLRIASGAVAFSGEGEAPTLVAIEACCKDCPEDQLASSAQAAEQALHSARAMDALLTERLGTQAPDLKPLLTDLAELHRFLQPQWVARSGVQPDAEPEHEAVQMQAGEGDGAPAAVVTGRIAGPADVLRRIDELCDYYARYEPSSPVPILLRRAQRLVGKDFLELLEDLAPGGIDDLKRVSGAAQGG